MICHGQWIKVVISGWWHAYLTYGLWFTYLKRKIKIRLHSVLWSTSLRDPLTAPWTSRWLQQKTPKIHFITHKTKPMKNKRLLICTIGGLLAGIICSAGGLLSGNIAEFSFFGLAGVFVNRLMLGFIIGISRLKINYLLHGILMGFLVSFIISVSFLENNVKGFIFFTTAGIIYGFLIELFAVKVFKAKLEE